MPANKALLVQPNYRQKKDSAIWGISPPINLAYIAAVLEDANIEVEILDANLLDLSPQQVVHRAIETKADIVGISILTPAHNYSVSVAKLLPKTILSVAGGAHAASIPDELLKDGFDVVVRGEGEYTMLDLVRGTSINDIHGVSYIKNGDIVNNKGRSPIDPNSLPFPARHLLFKNGVDRPYSSEGTKFFPWSPIITARGCPYRCYYCNKVTFGTSFAPRSPENVIEEMVELVSKYKVKEINVYDDCFNFDMDRAGQILDLMIENKLRPYLRFSNGLRADRINAELLSKMKKAGCNYIAYGIESGSQEVLDNIPKAIKLDAVRKAVALTRKQKITTVGFFMLGLIGETEESMQETINLAKELDLDVALFNIAIPYPGTRMWHMIKEKGRLLLSNWDDYYHTSGKMVYEYPDTASPEMVERMLKKAVKDFYFRPKYIIKQIPKMLNPNNIPSFMKGAQRVLFSQSEKGNSK